MLPLLPPNPLNGLVFPGEPEPNAPPEVDDDDGFSGVVVPALAPSPNIFVDVSENTLIGAFEEVSWSLSSLVLLPNSEKDPDEPELELKKEVLDEPVLKKLVGLTAESCDEANVNGFGLDAEESLDVLKESTALGALGAVEESGAEVLAWRDAAEVELGLESVVVDAGKLKADVLDPLVVPNLGVKPPPGVADDDDDDGCVAKPVKLVGGTGMIGKENVDVLVVLCDDWDAVLSCKNFSSKSFWTEIRCFLYCSITSVTSRKGSDSRALDTAEMNDALRPRSDV
jgi:hypothetical protein